MFSNLLRLEFVLFVDLQLWMFLFSNLPYSSPSHLFVSRQVHSWEKRRWSERFIVTFLLEHAGVTVGVSGGTRITSVLLHVLHPFPFSFTTSYGFVSQSPIPSSLNTSQPLWRNRFFISVLWIFWANSAVCCVTIALLLQNEHVQRL